MKLSGWQRPGVVITLAWIAASFGYAFWLHVDEKRTYPASVYAACFQWSEGKDEGRCAKLYQDTRQRWSEIPFHWTNPLILGLGPVLPFWLASWTLLAVAR